MNQWTETDFIAQIKQVGQLVHEKGKKKSQREFDQLVDKLSASHGLFDNSDSPGYVLIHSSIVSVVLNYNRGEEVSESTKRQIARAWNAVNTAQREASRNLQPQS